MDCLHNSKSAVDILHTLLNTRCRILFNLTRFPADPFQFVPHELPESSPERYTAHGIQQEVDTEVRVIEEHCELLGTPQNIRRRSLPQIIRKEDVHSYGIA